MAVIAVALIDDAFVHPEPGTSAGDHLVSSIHFPTTAYEGVHMSQTPTTPVPRQRGDELLAMLVDRLGARLGASTVYGTPVERDGVTVVPVAVARIVIGGGSGSDPSKRQEGEGGGGIGTGAPAGYIELTDGRSRFVPIVHPTRMVALILVAAIAAFAIMRPALDTPRPRKFRRR